MPLSTGGYRYHVKSVLCSFWYIFGTVQALASISTISHGFSPRVPRSEAQSIIDDQLMPKQEYGERIGWGRDAQGFRSDSSEPIHAKDPRLTLTYAEFPLSSMDALLDLGLQYLPDHKKINQDCSRSSSSSNNNISMLDLGSGCGRLVFYAAMTRGSPSQGWDIQGIEISQLLHDKGIDFIQNGMRKDIFFPKPIPSNWNSFSLHLGPAKEYYHLFQEADIVFAYSTAFSATHFSPELGALLMDKEWSQLLGESCRPGCVVITTDRALDPMYGWELVDRLDVENPDVFGTTGFVQIRVQ